MKDHGGHETLASACGAEGGAAAEMLLGWLLWLRAWLTGGELPTVARDGSSPRVEPGAATYALPDGWGGVPGLGEAYSAHRRQSYRHLVTTIALADRLGSERLAFQRWRRVFRVFIDFRRTLRGDTTLPRAHARLPEGGCGPPPVWQPSVLPPPVPPSKRGA